MKEKATGQSKIGNIIGLILCIILLPILVVNVTMIVKGAINSSKVPTFGGYAPLIVLTDSMLPDIRSGDLIIIKAVDAESVQVGDVISFFDPDGNGSAVVTHRVVAIETEGGLRFITRGDANNADDRSPVPAENLVGRYQTRIAGAGNVAIFLQSTPGLVVCVAVPMALLIAVDLLRRKKYDKAQQEDTQALLAELEALRAKQAEAEKKAEKTE